MNRRSTVSWAVAALLLLSAAGVVIGQGPGAAPPPPNLPAEFNTQTGQRIKVTMVAGGLFHPWSLAFADARTILVGERNGRLRVIRDGALQAKPAWEAPPHPATDNGLQFITLHPRFAENGSSISRIRSAATKGTRWRCRAAASTAPRSPT